jgi:hypothetical protein
MSSLETTPGFFHEARILAMHLDEQGRLLTCDSRGDLNIWDIAAVELKRRVRITNEGDGSFAEASICPLEAVGFVVVNGGQAVLCDESLEDRRDYRFPYASRGWVVNGRTMIWTSSMVVVLESATGEELARWQHGLNGWQWRSLEASERDGRLILCGVVWNGKW